MIGIGQSLRRYGLILLLVTSKAHGRACSENLQRLRPDSDKSPHANQLAAALAVGEKEGFSFVPVGPSGVSRFVTPYGHRSTDGVKTFLNGNRVREVFITTHQGRDLQEHTARELSRPRWQNVPRLFLVSPAFNITSSEVFEQASVFEYSSGGEFASLLDAETIHLAGGEGYGCMRETFFDAVEKALFNPEREEVHVVLHSDMIYRGKERLGWVELGSPDAALSDVLDFVHNSNNPDNPLWYEGSSADDEGFHFTFRRDSDRRHVIITATR